MQLSDEDRRRRIALLAISAFAAVSLWQTYWGGILLYPFTILSTWFHEMGHGLAASLVGYRFQELLIYPDGSGVALSLVPEGSGSLAAALVAAGGPLGPPLAGAALIIASRTQRGTDIALVALGTVLLLSTAIWVRSLTGWLVLVPLALALLAIAWRDAPHRRQLVVQMLGVLACVSTYRQTGYLFSQGGVLGGLPQRSDTQAIADALFGTYWLWGAIITAGIALLLWRSFAIAFRK